MPQPTIVSITPKALDHDSRTLKQAVSFARWGMRSVVYEGLPSTVAFPDLPIEVRSLTEGLAPVASQPVPATPQADGPPKPFYRNIARGSWLWRVVRRLVMAVERSAFGRGLERLSAVPIIWAYVRCYVLTRRDHIEAAALYYVHSYEYLPMALGLARSRGVPLVYDAHDFYGHIHSDLAASPLLADRSWAWIIRTVHRLCLPKVDAFITVSDELARHLQAAWGRRAEVVRNCHDYRLDREPRCGLRERLGLRPEDFVLVTMGDCKPGQAITVALDALARLPGHVHWVQVGRGYDVHAPQVEARGLAGRVHRLGPVSPREVVPTLREADASLILYFALTPDYLACLPNGFFQSVAACLPVLYPPLPELGRLCETMGLGLAIDPQDHGSILAAVNRLLAAPASLEEWKKQVAAAAPLLSWEREESPLRTALEGLLQREGAACAV